MEPAPRPPRIFLPGPDGRRTSGHAGTYGGGTELKALGRLLRRRKWVVLPLLLAVPAAAVGYTITQTPRYRATANVVLNTQNLATTTSGVPNGIPADASRIAETQASVARAKVVARGAVHAVPQAGITANELLASSSVRASSSSDVLVFAVESSDPVLAPRLAFAYANAFTRYRRYLDTRGIIGARASIARRLATLRPSGAATIALRANLIERDQGLAVRQAIQSANASTLESGHTVTQTQPRTAPTILLGVLGGIVLALGAALLVGFNRRIRDPQEISEGLGGIPLLARIPAPSDWLQTFNRLALLADPQGIQAHAFRLFRSNLEFVTFERNARTIMITSAVEQEGKSTTVANLAVALARAGHRVALVDLDLRRPMLAGFFGIAGPGITQVALGTTYLEHALVPVAVSGPRDASTQPTPTLELSLTAARKTDTSETLAVQNPAEGQEVSELIASLRRRVDSLSTALDTAIDETRRPVLVDSGNGNGTNGNGHENGAGRTNILRGSLELLPAGATPPDPARFVGTRAVANILDRLRARVDIVLIDGPPMSDAIDATTLSARVDGIVVVTQAKTMRKARLNDLARGLATVPTPVLGFVITGADDEVGHAYREDEHGG